MRPNLVYDFIIGYGLGSIKDTTILDYCNYKVLILLSSSLDLVIWGVLALLVHFIGDLGVEWTSTSFDQFGMFLAPYELGKL